MRKNKVIIGNENLEDIVTFESTTSVSNQQGDGGARHRFSNNKWIQFLKTVSKKVDDLGVEATGITRVPPYQRGTLSNQCKQVAGYWVAATGGLSSMSSYLLGPLVFDLTFKQSMASGLISMIIGCIIAAYCSTMGPQSGCRQMVTARYLFGWWMVKLVALASITGVLGWSVVNSVVGGEMLAAISNDKIPISIGIIIVSILSFIVAVFGIKQVLRVETLISVPVILTFMLLYISSSDKIHYIYDFDNSSILNHQTLKGNWLTFFSLCYSITSTWGSIASDYSILFPEDTPKALVFCLTFFGTAIPTLFVGILGIILSSIATSYKPWLDEYDSHGMGGLLWMGFERWKGFGKFCVVILILSLVSNNIINTYSGAFSIQLSSLWAARIPRWFWCIVNAGICLVCSLVGRNHFSTILGNFLPMIGYWISMYFILLLEENEIFRRFFLHLYTKEFPLCEDKEHEEDGDTGSIEEYKDVDQSVSKEYGKTISTATDSTADATRNRNFYNNIHLLKRRQQRRKIRYNWDKWDDYNVLTHGYAATFAFLCGVAGVVIGMAQAYWVGPVARKLGDNGGDIAMWLSMGISGLVFPICRYLELRYYGR